MKKKYLLLTTITIIGFAATTIGQNIPPDVPINGLIGWWPFDGNANDESGNNNNGTNYGATLTTDRFGHADSAYLFDGTSSYISIPSSVSLESPTSGLTLSAWVNLAGFSLVGQAFDPVLTKSDNPSNAFMYRFDIDINGVGYYSGINNWTTNIGTSYNFQLNQWYLVSAVLDSFTTYLYLDDTLVASVPFTTNILNNTLPLEFGRDVPGVTEVFNGKIDDIGIWNRALSQQEITNLYNGVNVGIGEPMIENQLNIYPNPATHQINVQVNSRVVGSTYIISDPLGKIIMTGKLNSKSTIIHLDNLPAGIYILSVGDNVKQRFNIVKN